MFGHEWQFGWVLPSWIMCSSCHCLLTLNLIIWNIHILYIPYGSFPDGSLRKKSSLNAGHAGDVGSTPGSERSHRVGNGNPLLHSCLENPMDKENWWATVHGVAKSQTWLSNWACIYSMCILHIFILYYGYIILK